MQAFGFGDGAGNYSLIVYNLNLTSSEAITFSGAAAPTGTCTKTVFTSTNITDNNESARLSARCTPVVRIQPPGQATIRVRGHAAPVFDGDVYLLDQHGADMVCPDRTARDATMLRGWRQGLPGRRSAVTVWRCCLFRQRNKSALRLWDLRFLYDDQTYRNRAELGHCRRR